MLFTMCESAFKCWKLYYLKSISAELINFKNQRCKNKFAVYTDFRFFFRTKFTFNLVDHSFEKFPIKTSGYFLRINRKNHYVPRLQRIVYKPVVQKSKEKESFHTSLMESLQKCTSVEDQIKTFFSMAKLPDEEIQSRNSICKNLERTLQPHFPSCNVSLIGSSINGLGIRGCDVDLSIQFPNRIANEQYPAENACLNDESGEKKFANKVYATKFQLTQIKRALQTEKYDEPLTIIPGRCPILSFAVQNLLCDLSVNNVSALQATHLTLLCGKLDERVTPLMQIIVYFAKQSKLIGGPWKFKTYAIFLMVVYFLQTRNPPVLPSVKTMLEKTDFLKNLENWSYDVTAYLDRFEKSNNSQTVEELLREFFFFYRSYDYSQIICPINSTSIDRKSFDCKDSFELSTICIQDPLYLERNVAMEVTWKKCRHLQVAIILVCEKYQDEKLWITGSQKWGLPLILDKAIK